MTRKEEIEKKADEISAKYGNSKVFPTEEECVAYNTAIEMAKWADHTMIEKAIEWLRENIYNRVYECGDKLGFPTADFIEDFKKAMEE